MQWVVEYALTHQYKVVGNIVGKSSEIITSCHYAYMGYEVIK